MLINGSAINEVEINGAVVTQVVDYVQVKATIKTVFSLNAVIKNTVKTSFSLTSEIKRAVKTVFDLLDKTQVKASVKTTFNLLTAPSTTILPIDAVLSVGGHEIDILTANISQDEDSWTWAFNATIADQINWDVIKPSNGNYPQITLTARGISFNLMIEGMQRSRRDVNSAWAINGRGITARLDGKYASGVDTSWRDVNAKTIIGELCTDAGITLDYQTVDWKIAELDGQGRYPIEIINEIASAIGAVVQTTPDGILIIRPRYAVKPADYIGLTPDFVITETEDYITLDEQWLDRDNYNTISVGDEEVDERLDERENRLTITSEDDLDQNGEKLSENKIVKIYSVPFIDDITLDDSSEGALGLIYQGIVTKTIELEAVEIVKGVASLSLPFYGLISNSYIHSDLGALTISESGEIKTATEEQSLVNISYTTKYHKYVATRTSNDKYLQIFAEVES